MHTYATVLEATQHAGVLGEERGSALAHLEQNLKGPKAQKRHLAGAAESQVGPGVRFWDDASGTYDYRYD
jgi:hypothetical protein